MAGEITSYMNKEIVALENNSDHHLVQHFGNKILKIALEASKFEIEETQIDFEELQPMFEKMNLGISRYERILQKLAAKDLDNFFETKSLVISPSKIQCMYEGCQQIVEGNDI